MRLLSCFAVCLFASLSFSSNLQAASITIAGISVDDRLFADDVNVITGRSAVGPNLVGTDFFTSYGVALDDVVEVIFTDNTVENETGYDLFFYETGAREAPSVGLTATGPAIVADLVARDDSRTITDRAVNIWGIDLSDFFQPLGPAQSTYFLRGATAGAPEILAVTAPNGQPLDVAPVPLPSGLLLMLTGLGGVAMVRRKAR